MSKAAPTGIVLTIAIILLLCGQLFAVGPTDEAIEKWKIQGILEQKLANWQKFRADGGCAPAEHPVQRSDRASASTAAGVEVVDTIKICVILTEFTDWPASGQNYSATASDFDSLLFSDRETDAIYNVTGSLTDFYFESSYGTLLIQGDIYGWYMMPQTYEYYVGSNDGLGGTGRQLAADAVDAAEAAGVNFAPYANGDIYVDGVIVIHAGAGAETGAYGIWSHRSSISTRIYDGVRISDYTLNPEEYGGGISTMGVYSHEWGHAMGLPDLYDTNNSSPGSGLGRWSMMAGGSWNDNGRTPAGFDAWCKMQLGFVDVIWLDSNLANVEIPQVETNPVVYGLGENPGEGTSVEYWLIENRQRVGFDAALPGSGLCIFHADNSVWSQSNPGRYKVALEQADGDNDLSLNGGSDGGDPYPGTTNAREFHNESTPNSRDNDLIITQVGVWNISNSDSLMYADLDVTFSRAWLEPGLGTPFTFSDVSGGDGDGLIEAGETIDFHATIVNKMRVIYDPIITLSTDDPALAFTQNSILLAGEILTNGSATNVTPIQFVIPADFESIIASFTINIVGDSVDGSGDGLYSSSFSFEQIVGAPQVLIIDDDGGEAWEVRLQTAMTNLRRPVEVWDKLSGTPTLGDLSGYKNIIWHTGVNTGGGGTITAGDVAVIKQYLDAGGNIFLSSLTAAADLHTLDSAFMADYLHANLVSSNNFALAMVGNSGSQLGDGVQHTYDGNAPINPMHDRIAAIGTAEESYHLADDFGNGDFGACVVAYTGSYRSVFSTLPVEFMNDPQTYNGFEPKDTLIQRVLSYFNYSYPYVQELGVEGEDIGMLINHTPTFFWSSRDTIVTPQTDYEIEFGTDNDWTAAELYAPGVTASADTSVAYAGAALVDGETYYLRLRVNNGTYWSDWYSSTFVMNSAPLAPTALSPVENKITDASPTLVIANGSDAETQALGYMFEVYDDAGLTNLVANTPYVIQSDDSTAWTVGVILTELTDHWWRARTFDGAEYSDWSVAAAFTVNSAYEIPTGQLSLASFAILPCDTELVVQPVIVNASKPLTEAVIPISIPSGVMVSEISFDGLTTAGWDLNNVVIDEVGGFVVVSLANSSGMTIPTGEQTVFNIMFQADVPCNISNVIYWDTTRYDTPSDQLKFTDTMEVFSPDFILGSDSTEILPYTAGDVDGNPGVDIGDLTALISYLFIEGPSFCNVEAGDANGDCVGPDIGDLTWIIAYLFIDGDDPLCGCSVTSAPSAPRQNQLASVRADYTDGQTTISINSSAELRGIQLQLTGSVSNDAQNIASGQFEIFDGQVGEKLQVLLVDIDGGQTIKSGLSQIVRLDGEYTIDNAQVSDLDHNSTAALVTNGKNELLPSNYALEQNYPNPFNPTTKIGFALPTASNVKLELYNVLGQKVVTMFDDYLEAGFHNLEWDGRSQDGEPVASGIYFYRLSAADFSQTKKMMLLK